MAAPDRTNPQAFQTSHSRAEKVRRLVWNIAHALLFRPSPWFMGAWRSWLLSRFGARMKFARFNSSAKIWAPWLLETGEHVYIDMDVNLYNAFGIRIGDRVVISQGSFLCSATHDYVDPTYPLTGKEIVVEDDCWIAAQAFIAPGVTIGRGAVVGARAVVIRDVPPWTVVAGNPAKVIKQRTLNTPPEADAAAATAAAVVSQQAGQTGGR
jgi:putative colanic acid biosynthesis acetyltransferase WcaF